MTEWKPIETAPEERATSKRRVLVSAPEGIAIAERNLGRWVVVWGEYRYAFEISNRLVETFPTLWMPILDPPSELAAGPVRNDPDTGIAAAIVKGIGK